MPVIYTQDDVYTALNAVFPDLQGTGVEQAVYEYHLTGMGPDDFIGCRVYDAVMRHVRANFRPCAVSAQRPRDETAQDIGDEKSNIPCAYFRRGRCDDETCRFAHSGSGPTKFGICFDFLLGGCVFGDGCVHYHQKHALPDGFTVVKGKVIAPPKYTAGHADLGESRCGRKAFCDNKDCGREHWCGRNDCQGPCGYIHSQSGRGVMLIRDTTRVGTPRVRVVHYVPEGAPADYGRGSSQEPCRFGARCRSLTGGTPCQHNHLCADGAGCSRKYSCKFLHRRD